MTDTIYDLNPSSNLLRHAHAEMKRAGYSHDDLIDMEMLNSNSEAYYQAMLYKGVMELIHTFQAQDHSGFSAALVRDMFAKLSGFEALTPLTDDPSEWQDHGNNLWQNRRNSEAFSINGGRTYYILSESRRWVNVVFYGIMPIGRVFSVALGKRSSSALRIRLTYPIHKSKSVR